MAERPNPYAEGKCFYGLKIRRRHEVVPCGLDARLYDVSRIMSNSDVPSPLRYKVWLCENHRKSMINDDFIVALATVDSVK